MANSFTIPTNFIKNTPTKKKVEIVFPKDELYPADSVKYEVSAKNQVIASIICNMAMFCFGCAVGWSSPTGVDLEATSFFSQNQSTWSGSLIPLGAIISIPSFGYISSKFGRKAGGYFTGILFVFGFALKIKASSGNIVLIGRLFCGIAGGSATTLPTLYIGETVQTEYRGLLSSLMMVEYGIGLLLTFVVGMYIDAHLLALILLPGPIIFLIAYWFIPETPSQLLRQGDEEGAAQSLAWFRKLPLNCGQLTEELLITAEQLGLSLPLKHPKKKLFSKNPNKEAAKEAYIPRKSGIMFPPIKETNEKKYIHSLKLLFTTKVGISGLHITFTLVTAQTFTGLFAVEMYTKNIFKDAGSPISSDMSSIIYAVFFLAGSTFGCLYMDKAGRRVLQIASSAIVFVCHLALSVSLKIIHDSGKNQGIVNYIPLIALPVCVFAYNVGVSVIPFVIVSEIFDLEVKDIATTIIMAWVWISTTILLFVFPPAVEAIGLYATFIMFAIVALWSTIYFYYFLIETKGKPIEQILFELAGSEKILNKNFNELNRRERASKLVLYSVADNFDFEK